MPYICYREKTFNPEHTRIIEQADAICSEYAKDGYTLTLRQIYYQFVARDLLKNDDKEYDRLGSIINDARLAGLLDWDAIEDRTRNLETLASWDSPKDILRASARQFRYDRWDSQDCRVEIWVEKEALAGVIERVAQQWRVPFLACRGYMSQSEAWRAGQRFEEYGERGQDVHVLHLGDHDPSGIDMTRDNDERLQLFSGAASVEVHRLALNMDQVRRYRPPPNPAKLSDGRARAYIERFGPKSWELDALPPDVINKLIADAIGEFIDQDRWDAAIAREQKARDAIDEMAQAWSDDE